MTHAAIAPTTSPPLYADSGSPAGTSAYWPGLPSDYFVNISVHIGQRTCDGRCRGERCCCGCFEGQGDRCQDGRGCSRAAALVT